MADIMVGDVVQVVQTWDTPLESVAQNVWHLIMESGAGADPDDLATAVLQNQQAGFGGVEDYLSDEFEVVLIELRQWDFTLHRFDGIATIAATQMIGQSVADYEPHGVAGLGRIVTENARRQGGTFIPGITDDNVVDGVLSVAAEAGLLAYLGTFDTDIAPTGGFFSWCTFNVDPLSPVYETESKAAGTVIANSLPSYLSKRKPGTGL